MSGSKAVGSATAFLVSLITVSAGSASNETVLYSFPANAYAYGRLKLDDQGELIGTASQLDGYGAIYSLKQKNGIWEYKTLFKFDGEDGANPAAGLIQDRVTGAFYGTTESGGTSNSGTVYALTQAARGESETILHNFAGSDGANPITSLLKDQTTGILYGTALDYGPLQCGTAFDLVPSNGSWTFNTIYAFQGRHAGCYPSTQLLPGLVPGTLIGAGGSRHTKLFQLKESGGAWTESVIHDFRDPTGINPKDLDTGGKDTFYGVAAGSGPSGAGVVFSETLTDKKWLYRVIYAFKGGTDGTFPWGLNFDSKTSILYGVTAQGGEYDSGTVFQLTRNGKTWTKTILHDFAGGADGADPYARPIIDHTTGALYGTTTSAGANNGGTVYRVQP